MKTHPTPDAQDKTKSWQMFNRIAGKYDLNNRVLSLGLDLAWRRKLARQMSGKKDLKVLDLATGTADVPIILFQQRRNMHSAYGIDLADEMLEIGREKIRNLKLEDEILLKHGDAMAIPFPDRSFDHVTMAFGIRNVPSPDKVLQEMRRVLLDGGKALILEFSLPVNPFVRACHIFYLRHIVPFLGGIISGQREAYRYLNNTIEEFPYGEDFVRLMKDAGFHDIRTTPLLFGTATIYSGTKKT